jgi:hypothetical protein
MTWFNPRLFCALLMVANVVQSAPRDPVAEYERHAAAVDHCAPQRFQLPVLTDGLELSGEDQRHVLYRMNFNQVTEGWNWHPEAVREDQDYYQYKFLPLASVDELRGSYRGEDKIGEAQEFQVKWRYDYFFAFDNLYEFFARRIDDDAGFSVDLPAAMPLDAIAMAAEVNLRAPCISQSTTFWKATHARPVDFTLKKRYLLGDLDAVVFYDKRSGKELARVQKSALVKQLSNKAVEQKTLSSPLLMAARQ